MQLFRGLQLRAPGEAFFDEMGVAIDLPIDWKVVIHFRQHQGGAIIAEILLEGRIDPAEVAKQPVLRLFTSGAVAVEYGARSPATPGARV